ncbi:hypothetical protein ACFWAZ_27015 [Streptomyces collinus]|uniref:hypothetical protein n=1 Tax=Streptomyces collinus TaxID=42684 RepID=UPI00366897A6
MEVGLARGAYQFEFGRLAGGLAAADGGKHLRELVPRSGRSGRTTTPTTGERKSLELFITEVVPAFQ